MDGGAEGVPTRDNSGYANSGSHTTPDLHTDQLRTQLRIPIGFFIVKHHHLHSTPDSFYQIRTQLRTPENFCAKKCWLGVTTPSSR